MRTRKTFVLRGKDKHKHWYWSIGRCDAFNGYLAYTSGDFCLTLTLGWFCWPTCERTDSLLCLAFGWLWIDINFGRL